MFKYGMIHRGFSIGCQPMQGFIERRDADGIKGTHGREYFDILIYNRRLTDKEISDYELEFIGAWSN